ncbi:ferritin family protein [Halanaerobium hydrogeniformans]|uniref:Rubrerythrin n=1 Tax=Halanaerobium hydrogeniformans TaxID=656519 RepID=E4RN30_HALHG|nr:ferritin family protein [Halanaerobium hydrogeniformans]ADQ14247.1 Rubrerythrin [Halanaerobium hydrogeniformans]
MDIYEFAINFEQENRAFYEEFAEKCSHTSLKSVFLNLADEERKHENIIRQMRDNKELDSVESDILPKAKEAFEAISKDLPENEIFDTEQVDVYRKAIAVEEKSIEFYTEQAEKATDPETKAAFERLAEEEKKHEKIMRNITEMVNRPNTWLEDAEWYHLDEY